ncbi:MAG: bifunctional phosphoglucose/phosphomannose isomerase [Candidatus Woesearchaeota archaeon]
MNYDKSDMLHVLEAFPAQCKDAVKLVRGFKIPKKKYSNICVCGMGGSGIGGELLKPLAKKQEIITHHDYGLPNKVNSKSLVIVVSYSGNTEESLSAFTEAKKRKAKVVSITSGGKLAEKDKQAIIIPSGYEPRAAIGYLFLTIVAVLSNNKLIPNQSSSISEAIKLLDAKITSRIAFLLAKKIIGTIPIYYINGEIGAVAYRMKTQINENSKQPGFYHVFPEMNHNEILGFKRLGKKVTAVFILDSKDPVKIKKRMDITKKLIKNQTNVEEIQVKGKSLLARMLTTIYVGDLTSYYLALMNKEDPTPIPLINELKKKL